MLLVTGERGNIESRSACAGREERGGWGAALSQRSSLQRRKGAGGERVERLRVAADHRSSAARALVACVGERVVCLGAAPCLSASFTADTRSAGSLTVYRRANETQAPTRNRGIS